MWTLKEYEQAAKQIGEEYINTSGAKTINDLAIKVASDGQLNREGIRTVVRIANVIAFEKAFEKKSSDGSGDRMINFELGDPEIVIQKLYKEAVEENATIDESTSYDQTMDRYGDMPTKSASHFVKEASAAPMSEPTRGPSYSPAEVMYKFKIAEAKMEADKKQAEYAWNSALEKAAQCVRVDVGSVKERAEFEKDALACLGEDYQAELVALNMMTSPGQNVSNLFGGEKVAHVMEYHAGNINPKHKRATEFIKEARDARRRHDDLVEGLSWVRATAQRIPAC